MKSFESIEPEVREKAEELHRADCAKIPGPPSMPLFLYSETGARRKSRDEYVKKARAELAQLGQESERKSDTLQDRLRTKSAMMNMGEKIAWGSDTALMNEAADRIDALEAGLLPFASALRIAREAMCPHPDRGHVLAVALLYVKHEELLEAMSLLAETE